MQLCHFLFASSKQKNSLERGAAKKNNKATSQYDVFMDIWMMSTCRFSALLLLTPELPVLFLDVFAADYAVMFPSGH